MKRLIRDEKGQVMVLAVILLLVGGLIVSSLLSYMGTGLLTGRVYERRTAELYAADAGVEDAVWKIQHQVDEVYQLYCGQGNHTLSYNITDVNGKSVSVTIAYVDALTYNVTSIATGNSSGTEITAYVSGVNLYGDYSGLLNQIITSQGIIDTKNGVNLTPPSGPNGPLANYTGAWPTPSELKGFYWEQVKDGMSYSSPIDLSGQNTTLQGGYGSGGTLFEIYNSNNDPATLKLTGTLYITPDTQIGATGHGFTLDLNGHIIFVGSNSTKATNGKYALEIGTKCTSIKGPGAIIAVGDVYFGPNSDAGSGSNSLFILSVSGTTTIRPGINLYGAIAGSVEVEVQQGNDPTITYSTGGFGDLNFLMGVQRWVYSIASWEVSQQ